MTEPYRPARAASRPSAAPRLCDAHGMAGRTILFAAFSLGVAVAALLPLGCSPKVRDFGAGGGGMGEPCTPGDKMACYDGPEPTKDIGLCKSGMKTCQP